MNVDVDTHNATGPKMVYVRQVRVSDLPREMRAEVEGRDLIYALHREDGAPLALVGDRATAFAVARENDLTAVSVH